MAGRFLNTQDTLNTMAQTITANVESLINNPYYLYSDKKGSEVTYFNINTTMTTLDEATRGNYAEIAHNSPLRFNKIEGFYLFGLTRMEPNLDISDFGLETSDIAGEAIVLPNTIIPYPGDRFYVTQLEKTYRFKVTAVNPNTLETGKSLYKINYTLENTDGITSIEPQVVKRYKFILQNAGTNDASSLVEADDYELASGIEDLATTLKDYYMNMFYDSRIQSFSYVFQPNGYHPVSTCNMLFGEFHVHDPYLLEFIIRNKIMVGGTNYVKLMHQLYLPNTFGVAYDRTIFSSIEHNDLCHHVGKFSGNLLLVDRRQQLSLLYAYHDDYYYMEYDRLLPRLHILDVFDDPDFINKIKNNEITDNVFKDIIIGYFNGSSVTTEQLEKLRHVDYYPTRELFYMIPITIFIIEQEIQNILAKTSE